MKVYSYLILNIRHRKKLSSHMLNRHLLSIWHLISSNRTSLAALDKQASHESKHPWTCLYITSLQIYFVLSVRQFFSNH